MKNAVIYTRVSTDEQAESGAGLKAQLDACTAFAQQQRWTVIGVFTDEGVSGTADLEKRIGLMAAIQALGKDDVLVVAKRDRIGRDVFLIKTIERLVIQRKAKIVALNGANEETPEASLLNGVMDQFAAYEVAVIRARTKAALAAKKVRGERMGKLPYGFTVVDDGVHLVPCASEQQILQRIVRLREKGASLRNMAATLNRERLFNRYGRPWNNVLLHTVCKNLEQRLAPPEFHPNGPLSRCPLLLNHDTRHS
ncbi:MAG: recombinase family protein [Candidatus Competibacteraceae bacterium]|nr:recombinase family protein [Candidatus Competibacteraceae bacterium]